MMKKLSAAAVALSMLWVSPVTGAEVPTAASQPKSQTQPYTAITQNQLEIQQAAAQSWLAFQAAIQKSIVATQAAAPVSVLPVPQPVQSTVQPVLVTTTSSTAAPTQMPATDPDLVALTATPVAPVTTGQDMAEDKLFVEKDVDHMPKQGLVAAVESTDPLPLVEQEPTPAERIGQLQGRVDDLNALIADADTTVTDLMGKRKSEVNRFNQWAGYRDPKWNAPAYQSNLQSREIIQFNRSELTRIEQQILPGLDLRIQAAQDDKARMQTRVTVVQGEITALQSGGGTPPPMPNFPGILGQVQNGLQQMQELRAFINALIDGTVTVLNGYIPEQLDPIMRFRVWHQNYTALLHYMATGGADMSGILAQLQQTITQEQARPTPDQGRLQALRDMVAGIQEIDANGWPSGPRISHYQNEFAALEMIVNGLRDVNSQRRQAWSGPQGAQRRLLQTQYDSMDRQIRLLDARMFTISQGRSRIQMSSPAYRQLWGQRSQLRVQQNGVWRQLFELNDEYARLQTERDRLVNHYQYDFSSLEEQLEADLAMDDAMKLIGNTYLSPEERVIVQMFLGQTEGMRVSDGIGMDLTVVRARLANPQRLFQELYRRLFGGS